MSAMSYTYLQYGNHGSDVDQTTKYFATYSDSNGSGYMLVSSKMEKLLNGFP